MAQSKPWDDLVDHLREAALLSSTGALLAWDQETYMPAGAGERRAEQLALVARLAHERAADARLGEWIEACAHGADEARAACLRELRRDHDRATRMPASLVSELAATESRAQQAWAEARAASSFERFRPWLQQMVALQQAKADCLKAADQTRWDALADLYEPGARAADLQALFGPLPERLVQLRGRLEAGSPPDMAFRKARIPRSHQESFVRAVGAQMGFDFDRGRVDSSAHPFCTNTGGDVRLTTRFHDDNVLDALGSTMHEAGHGLYEQGLPREHYGTPLGEAASLGVHESQSRLWENHVGRSEAFWRWCWPVAQQHLGRACDGHTLDSVYRLSNLVQPDLIRVEADEATYDLHVMARFELETALIDGGLDVPDVPERWNALYRDYLGVEVPDDARGCLQDVHWSCGLFGYFPTYTLGNLYAAQFAAAAHRALGDLDEQLALGEFGPLRAWLTENVHRHGRRYTPAELCERATGAPLSSGPFLDYLESKLTRVYGL